MPAEIVGLFAAVEFAYLGALLVTLWLYSLPVDLVDLPIRVERSAGSDASPHADEPEVIVLYPVLHELEATMRTSMLGLSRAEYPGGVRRVVAIPNADDVETIRSLERIAQEHPFLEILPIPPTSDPSWSAVWDAWDSNRKAYWWHSGKRRGERSLPAKKTRQLVFAFYALVAAHPDALLSYLDADSVVPRDYFVAAAAGMKEFDVLQNTNIAGNAVESWAATMFAMDHMQWDGSLYQHMTARGKHPYYVLGKGLFFRVRDLVELGGFNPWLTIEDPEVGMRLWVNGRRLGVIRSPLIEEVPNTFAKGITQRKRWIAGFFQTLGHPLTAMGMSWTQRMRARLNLVPCASLSLNPIGVVVGVWALVLALSSSHRAFPLWLVILCGLTIAGTVCVIFLGQRAAWLQTGLLFGRRRERIAYMLRVNPLITLVYWLWWAVPLAIGFWMFVRDEGLVWERTEKLDANAALVREANVPLLLDGCEDADAVSR